MNIRRIIAAVVALAACFAPVEIASASDTEFTYQGLLKQNGQLVNGSTNFTFSCWDALAGGNQVGGDVVRNGVQVTNGLFTVTLDFGSTPFNNSDRWLEIEVGATTLSPRQPITRAPYSMQTRGIFVNPNETFVGIGRSTPLTSVESFGIHCPVMSNYGGMYLSTDGEGAWPFYGYAAGATADMWTYYNGTTGDWIVHNTAPHLTVAEDGFVGVGRRIPVTGAEAFGVQSDTTNGYGGMYISTLGGSGWPFYGYAAGGDGDMWHYYDGDTDKWHVNNGGNRLTVDGFGNVGIGTEFPTARLDVKTSNPGDAVITAVHQGVTGNGPTVFAVNNSASGRALWGLAGANSGINFGVVGGSDSPTGFDFYADGAGFNYGASSSIRWKENIHAIENPLAMIEELRGVYFDWDTEHGGHHDIGCIAEEVGVVLPEIVGYEENGIDAIGMDYSKLTPLLVEAIKALREEKASDIAALRAEQDAEIMALRAEVAELRSFVAALSERQAEDTP